MRKKTIYICGGNFFLGTEFSSEKVESLVFLGKLRFDYVSRTISARGICNHFKG